MNNVIICLALMAAIGILLCFFGRRFINLSLPLVAFIVVMRYVIEHFGKSEYTLIVALLAGLAGALLARFAKRAAFFMIGAMTGFFAGSVICRYVVLESTYGNYIIMAGCALILGFLFMKWNNFFISVITAYIGAQRLACLSVFLALEYNGLAGYGSTNLMTTFQSLEDYLENTFTMQYAVYILLITIIFMLLGISAQNHYGYTRHRRR